LDAIDLEIAAGELFFLLGPSGCGKSTLLRLIAGLHAPTSGRILFNGKDVTALGTDKRNAVMCFQSYALWPHMSVRDNVQFGLDIRGTPRPARCPRGRGAESGSDGQACRPQAESTLRRPTAARGVARALAVNPIACCSMSR